MLAAREALYPPDDGSVPMVDTAQLLARHGNLVADILQASSLAPADARELLGRPIEAFARHVGMLPATRDAYYAGQGGLLRLGLDNALLAARKAQVAEFSGLGRIERRRLEAPRWRLACILTALCHDLHRTVTEYAVCAADGAVWSPLYEALADFAASTSAERVHLHWRARGKSEGIELAWNLPLASAIVDRRILRFLYEGGPEVLAHFYAALSSGPGNQSSNAIGALVLDARARLIARDQAMDPLRFGKRGLGTSLGPYLADALLQLKSRGRWTVNDDLAHVWVSRGAVFLIWPKAAADIRGWLEEIEVHGVPRDDQTIADLLADARLVIPLSEVGNTASLPWPIRLPGGREVTALRLAVPELMFPEGELPDAYDLEILPAPATPTKPTAPTLSIEKTESPSSARSTPVKPGDALSGIDEAMKILDYPTQLLIKEVRKLLTKPKSARGQVQLRADGALRLHADWIRRLGFDAAQVESRLRAAGWLVNSRGDAGGADDSKIAVVFHSKIARLLMGSEGPADLLSTAAPKAEAVPQ